ncbi:MAG: acyltransferase family protein [Clostridiales bacterium]|nr:acyltransferase family protein [Clostridiales bacterium]
MAERLNKERVDYIDFIRGIGIFLMVCAHIPFSDNFVHYVHAFHMPLFFFVSGALLKPGRGTAALLRRTKKLLVPYISFSAAAYLVWFLYKFAHGLRETSEFLLPLKAILWNNSSDDMPIAGSLWFLTAMIILQAVVFFLEKIHYKTVKCFIIVILLCFGTCETIILPFRLPFSAGAACVGLFFFYAGKVFMKYWCEKMKDRVTWKSVILCLILMFIMVFPIMKNGLLNMRTGSYGLIPLAVFDAVISLILIWVLAYKTTAALKKVKIGELPVKYIRKMGEYSIIYLCLNELVIFFCRSGLTKIVPDISRYMIAIVSFVVLFFATLLITHTRLSCFVGLKPIKF